MGECKTLPSSLLCFRRLIGDRLYQLVGANLITGGNRLTHRNPMGKIRANCEREDEGDMFQKGVWSVGALFVLFLMVRLSCHKALLLVLDPITL